MPPLTYAVWLCGAGTKRLRGYSGNYHHLRVSDEQHLRMALLDSSAAEDGNMDDLKQPLKHLMVTRHVALAESVVGLAIVQFSGVYASRLDHLSPEQRVVPLILH